MSVSFREIKIGQKYSRPELANLWGNSGYQALARGVVTPINDNKIILFITVEKKIFQEQYGDKLHGDILEWEGPTDHFAEERIINANKSHEEIHLFYRERHHMDFIYMGSVTLLLFSKGNSSPSKFQFELHQKEDSSFPGGKEKTIDHVFRQIACMESDLDAISKHLDSDLDINGVDTRAIDQVENQGLLGKKKDLTTRKESSKIFLHSGVAEKCMWLGITNLNEVAIFEVLDSKPEMIGEIQNVIELAVKISNLCMAIEEKEEVQLAFHRLLHSGFISLFDRSNRRLIFPNKKFWDRQTSELKLETLLIHEILLTFFTTPLYESALVIEVRKLMQLFHGYNPPDESIIFHLLALCRKDEPNSIKLLSSPNEGEEDKHLVLWNGDRQTLSEKIRDIRKRIETEKSRTISTSRDFESAPEDSDKGMLAIDTPTRLSVRQKIENILKEATTPLHYKEVEDKVFEKYNSRHATNVILNNSANIVRVLSGIFVHKENFSHAFKKEFDGEKAAVIEFLKDKINAKTKPLAIDVFSKELHKSGKFHRLNEKSIVAVVSAIRQIDPDFRIIPQPGNPRGRSIVHTSYDQQPSNIVPKKTEPLTFEDINGGKNSVSNATGIGRNDKAVQEISNAKAQSKEQEFSNDYSKNTIENSGTSAQSNKSDIQEMYNTSTAGEQTEKLGQELFSLLDTLMKSPAPQENVRYQTWNLWKQRLKNWNLENVRISYVAGRLGLEWSEKKAYELFSDYLSLNIHEIRDLALESKKHELEMRTMFLCVANIAEKSLKIGTAETTINVSKNNTENLEVMMTHSDETLSCKPHVGAYFDEGAIPNSTSRETKNNRSSFCQKSAEDRLKELLLEAELSSESREIVLKNVSNSAIDPEDVIAWLVTQPNANGTLYLENVVRQYMGALGAAPTKLQIPVEFDVRSVFTCHTPDELNAYWDIFRAAPNYKQVNSRTSGMFSAGMVCYMRYLQHLSDELNVEKPDVVQVIERHNLELVDKRDSGGALWVIGGRELSPTMLKLRDSGFPFTFKIGGGRSSDYRDAWWYKSSETVSGQKSEESEEAQPVYTEPKGITNSAQRVDFTHPGLCAQTRPLTCTIKGQAVVPSKQNWTQLLVAITERFFAEGNPNLDSLSRKPLYGSKIFFLPTKADFGACSLLSNGKLIYTNYNPQIIVTIIRNLCHHCGVDLDDVIITYEPKYGKHRQSVQTYTRPANVVPAVSPKPVLDPAVVEQLTDVLSSHFTNGYRLNSPIEMARFRTFAAEDLGKELTLTDEELKSYIAAFGTTFDEKVYAVSAQAKERIKVLAEDYFAEGARAIFFAEFYAKNENWLFEASVISEDMLIDILRRLFPKLSFTQTYFGFTDASVFSALESEILRVWSDDILLTYEHLAERLQYIPLERIKYGLGQNGDFIWSGVETFSHISRIDITDEEREAIHEAAVRECNARGYASITDLPFGEIEERNYELSTTAVHNAVYHICLSDKFDKKGKIVARKGDVFDALTIMKKYCRTIDKCSLDDLLTYEKELTGKIYRLIPMEAGNTVLVRIDKRTYVADRYVHFNADIIDEAIGLFVKGDYLPLKSFTTFGAFPDCGRTWNLFLLESYCRRFSRKFRFDTLSINSRNAGAVIRNSCGMDYTEIMTDAVANADVPLKDTSVGKFLYESGYTGRSTTAKVNEIIDKAKAIRERRD